MSLASRVTGQLDSLSKLREASSAFMGVLTRGQSDLRGVISLECQRLAEGSSEGIALELQDIEASAWEMVRHTATSVAEWGEQHNAKVEQLSTGLSKEFDQSFSFSLSQRPSLSDGILGSPEPRLFPEERVSGGGEGSGTGGFDGSNHHGSSRNDPEADRFKSALREKDAQLQQAELRALEQRANLQQKLSDAQRDVRRTHEEGTKRVAAMRAAMNAQASRIHELEHKMSQFLETSLGHSSQPSAQQLGDRTRSPDAPPRSRGGPRRPQPIETPVRNGTSGGGSVRRGRGASKGASAKVGKPRWAPTWPAGIPGESDMSAFGGLPARQAAPATSLCCRC